MVNQRGYSYASSEFVGTLRAVFFHFFVSDYHVVGRLDTVLSIAVKVLLLF